ncbi:MAG: adaptor protein MecA [Eubacterium sp.]|nr:adaptor protein MecA [Eubacterium sp.]
MKIEKINENKIRCTLTSEDLTSRDIRLSELAYGSEKSRKLFQDMMKEAHYEVGFDSGNSPLMIEAIPTSSDSLTLIITKVDDPEELDTRFSKFSQPASDPADGILSDPDEGTDTIAALFDKLIEARRRAADDVHSSGTADADAGTAGKNPKTDKSAKNSRHSAASVQPRGDKRTGNLLQEFQFDNLDDVISAARSVHDFYKGSNALYKTETGGDLYHLVVHQSGMSTVDFYRTCNVLSEYGRGSAIDAAGESFLREHGTPIVASNALYKLSRL